MQTPSRNFYRNPLFGGGGCDCSQFGVTGARGLQRPLTMMDAPPFDTTNMKYYDTILVDTEFVDNRISTCSDSWEDCIMDPSYTIHSLRQEPVDGNVPNPDCLFAPMLLYPIQPENNDNALSSRIGRSVYLHGITVRGEVYRTFINNLTTEYIGAYSAGGIVRLILVMDNQSNGLQLRRTNFSISNPPDGGIVIDDAVWFDTSGTPQVSQTGPQIYAPRQGQFLNRTVILDEVLLEVIPSLPALSTLPITLEVATETTTTGTTATSGTADGSVALTAGTGGPIALVTASTGTADSISTQTGSYSGLAIPQFLIQELRKPFELNYIFKQPLKIDFETLQTALPNKSTGTVLDCPSISFHILAARMNYPIEISLTYYSRCWFTDL